MFLSADKTSVYLLIVRFYYVITHNVQKEEAQIFSNGFPIPLEGSISEYSLSIWLEM